MYAASSNSYIDLHRTDISPFSSASDTSMARTLKLLAGMSLCSSAHAGQRLIAQTLDFLVASPPRCVSIDVNSIRAAKFMVVGWR